MKEMAFVPLPAIFRTSTTTFHHRRQLPSSTSPPSHKNIPRRRSPAVNPSQLQPPQSQPLQTPSQPSPHSSSQTTSQSTSSAAPTHFSPSSSSSSSSVSVAPSPISPIPSASSSRHVYDYIIVGGGAAGCVLANRLSASGQYRVALLESGPSSDDFLVNMPLGFPKLLGSSLDAAFVTQSEPELRDRRLYFPRGRCLGGSHAISVMLYHRGHPQDYHVWAEHAGNEWSPDSVAPYFLKGQHQTSSKKLENSSQHSVHGPLPVSDLRCVNPLSRVFVDAAVSQGLGYNDDFNNWRIDQAGAGFFQVTQRDGNRASPSSTYLSTAKSRKNLTVLSGVTVERVLFERENSNNESPIASGVQMVDERGRRVSLRASREVILSAGVYGSPQLLMLSGIGPTDHLSEHGIPTLVNSPAVGQNLQDHAAAMLSFHSKQPFDTDKKRSSLFYTENTGKDPRIILDYLLRGRGPLTSPMCEAGAFVRTRPGLRACDLQIRFIPFFSEPDPYGSLAQFANGGTYLRNDSNRPAGFSLQSVVARPNSLGKVTLRSVDVRDSLLIKANWMTDERDLETLVEGIKLCRQISSDKLFEPFRGQEIYPGPQIDSDDTQALQDYVRESCHTANAMVGTCRMGLNAKKSVVDSHLNVRGVSRLRVVDSSVMPTLPGGQSGAPTMMVAEKGADFILKDDRHPRSGERAMTKEESLSQV